MSPKPKILSINDPDVISESVKVLTEGGVIVYPTDTVYGLGADATNVEAVAKIKHLKNRTDAKSFLVMVSNVCVLEEYAEVNAKARKLAETFLPGPLALVLQGKGATSAVLASGDGSIGFRIPDSLFCKSLGEQFKKPIISTSANISEQMLQGDISSILKQFSERAGEIGLFVDGGICVSNTPSTILDARDDTVHVVREGAIPLTDLKQFLN